MGARDGTGIAGVTQDFAPFDRKIAGREACVQGVAPQAVLRGTNQSVQGGAQVRKVGVDRRPPIPQA